LSWVCRCRRSNEGRRSRTVLLGTHNAGETESRSSRGDHHNSTRNSPPTSRRSGRAPRASKRSRIRFAANRPPRRALRPVPNGPPLAMAPYGKTPICRAPKTRPQESAAAAGPTVNPSRMRVVAEHPFFQTMVDRLAAQPLLSCVRKIVAQACTGGLDIAEFPS